MGLAEFLNIGKKARIPAIIVAMVLVVVGGICSIFHLGQPGNIMAAATNIFSFSGISVELIMVGINIIVAIVFLILAARDVGGVATKVVGVIGIVTGLVLAFVVGNGYVMESQPYWNTIALPLGYLGSGLGMGMTLYAALLVLTKAESAELKKFFPWMICGLALQLILFFIYGITFGFSAQPVVFWLGVIALGGVCSLVAALFFTRAPQIIWVALICAVAGGIFYRVLMWLLGTGFLDFFQDAAARMVL
ncbi:MAG: hypothetical protein LUD72_04685 [Bacteroidales bacterium]|nr:hypothetical protein [Bacteroidales bacterium]